MAEQPNDFVRSLQELITNSATDQIRASRQFNELVQSIARGELNEREANERVRQVLTNTTSRYVSDLSRLTISFLQALRSVNRHYSDHFFDQVRGDFPQNEAAEDTLRRVELPVRAVLGDDIQRSFVIENRQDKACEVSFAVSEFAEVGGMTSFRAPLQLQPARFTLRPGEEQTVTLHLPLLPEFFSAGRQYEGTVLVRGQDNLMLVLAIDVEHAAAKQDQSAPIHAAYSNGAGISNGGYANGSAHANGHSANDGLVPDDMTRLKGIGPNYQQKLAHAGILRFADLAQVDEAYLRANLDQPMFRRAKRYDWQEQARLAAAGDEAGLSALKSHLPHEQKG